MIDKGGAHKHGGEVIHHHHHDGHVAHVHKHEGEAYHKHHHHGIAGHHHKHTGIGKHKHHHVGKAEHNHKHKGHGVHDHHHKGMHGHDHKHSGVFSSAHAHTGHGVHTHGHHGKGLHTHGHVSHLGYGMSPLEYGMYENYLNNENPGITIGQQPFVPLYNKFDQIANYHPFGPVPPAPEFVPISYIPPQNNFNFKPEYFTKGYAQYGPAYANNYVNQKGRGGVTTYSMSNVKHAVNTEYEEIPKPYQAVKLKKNNFNLFSPEETAELENSLTNFNEFGTEQHEDEKLMEGTPEFSSNESGQTHEEAFADASDELEKGEFQFVTSSRPYSKQYPNPNALPIVPYEVTEKLNAIL